MNNEKTRLDRTKTSRHSTILLLGIIMHCDNKRYLLQCPNLDLFLNKLWKTPSLPDTCVMFTFFLSFFCGTHTIHVWCSHQAHATFPYVKNIAKNKFYCFHIFTFFFFFFFSRKRLHHRFCEDLDCLQFCEIQTPRAKKIAMKQKENLAGTCIRRRCFLFF